MLPVSTKDASKLHKKFQDIDVDGSGVIDIDEFFQHLGIEKTPFGAKLFTLIGEHHSVILLASYLPCVRRERVWRN